jgi:hypothetical protein
MAGADINKKRFHNHFQIVKAFLLVPEAGLEPARCCHRQILSLVRLPFRHSGISVIILAQKRSNRQYF